MAPGAPTGAFQLGRRFDLVARAWGRRTRFVVRACLCQLRFRERPLSVVAGRLRPIGVLAKRGGSERLFAERRELGDRDEALSSKRAAKLSAYIRTAHYRARFHSQQQRPRLQRSTIPMRDRAELSSEGSTMSARTSDGTRELTAATMASSTSQPAPALSPFPLRPVRVRARSRSLARSTPRTPARRSGLRWRHLAHYDDRGCLRRWNANVTVSSVGVHTLTAQATNAGGAGTSNPVVDLVNASATLSGGNQFVLFSGSSEAVTLSNTSGSWDTVTGSPGMINLASAQASVSGGGNTVNFQGSDNAVTLLNSIDSPDTVTGPSGTINLASAQASVTGGGNTVNLQNSANAVTLYNTSGMMDWVQGSDSSVSIKGVQSLSLSGSNDAATAGPGDAITLTAGTGDTIAGTGFTVNASSGTGVTVGGNGEFGPLDVVNGSSLTVGVEANSHADVVGSNDTVTTTAANTVFSNYTGMYGSGGAGSVAEGFTPTADFDFTGASVFMENYSIIDQPFSLALYSSTGSGAPDTVLWTSGTLTVSSVNQFHLVAANYGGAPILLQSGVEYFLAVDIPTVDFDIIWVEAGTASSPSILGPVPPGRAIARAMPSLRSTARRARPRSWWSTARTTRFLRRRATSINLKTGTGDTITGTGFTVNASSGTGVTVGGNTRAGPLDVVNGSSATVGVETNSHADVTGSNDTVTIASGAASVLVVNGSNDAISAASGDTINLKTGTGDTITGTGFTVNASSGTGVTVGGNTESGPLDVVDGSSATVGVETNSHADVTGSNDTVTMASGAASVLVVNGSNDAITAASGDIDQPEDGDRRHDHRDGLHRQCVERNGRDGRRQHRDWAARRRRRLERHGRGRDESHAEVTGSNDTVTMTAGAASVLVVNGSNDAISAASGDTINLKTGTGDTITGTDFTVNAGSGVGLKIIGTADIVYAGLNNSITDGGSGSLFKIGGSVGSLKVSKLRRGHGLRGLRSPRRHRRLYDRLAGICLADERRLRRQPAVARGRRIARHRGRAEVLAQRGELQSGLTRRLRRSNFISTRSRN